MKSVFSPVAGLARASWLCGAIILFVAVAEAAAQGRWADDLGREIGMETFWRTQTPADGSQSILHHVVPHISNTDFRTVFEVIVGDTRRAFLPEMQDRWGTALGESGAERQADIERRVLRSQGIDAQIEKREFRDSALYIQTSTGVLQAIDAETGRIRWTVPVGSPGVPASRPGVGDHALASVIGSTLTVISPRDGRILQRQRLNGIPSGSVAIGGDWVFVPHLRGGVEVISLAKGELPRLLLSQGFTTGGITSSMGRLAWATDLGYLHVADAESASIKFRIETRGPIIHQASFAAEGTLCFGTSDGMVIAVSPASGDIRWQFMTGTMITQAPMVHDDFICAVTGQGDLYCLDLASGALRWRRSGIQFWAGVAADNLVLVDQQGNLLAVESRYGSEVGRSPLNGLSLLVSQVLTDRLFLTNGDGQVMALRPRGGLWPTIYAPVPPAEAAVEPDVTEPPTASPAGPAANVPEQPETPVPPVPEDSPFGTEEDPFAGEDPFAEGGGDNPFEEP